MTTGTINSGTDVAVRIDGDNASKITLGVTLDSVSSSGATNGININDTTGSFAVRGGGSPAAGTGGSILNSTSDGVILNDVQNISLAYMNINNSSDNGVKGVDVVGFVLDNSVVNGNGNAVSPDEAGLLFTNLTGDGGHPTAITNNTISNSHENNAIIRNSGGTLTNLFVTGSTFGPTPAGTGAAGLEISITGGSTTMTVSGSTFTNNQSFGIFADASAGTINIDISGATNVFSGTKTANCAVAAGIQNVGVSVSLSSTGNANFDIKDATFNGHRSSPINIFSNGTSTGNMVGTISGNTIGLGNTTSDGSCLGAGISQGNEGSGTATILVDNNIVRRIGDNGFNGNNGIVMVQANQPGTNNVTITNNNIDDVTQFRGIDVVQIIAGGTTCSNISGNDAMTNIGSSTDIRIRQTNGAHNVVQTSAANLGAVNNGATVNATGAYTFGVGACATPP